MRSNSLPNKILRQAYDSLKPFPYSRKLVEAKYPYLVELSYQGYLTHYVTSMLVWPAKFDWNLRCLKPQSTIFLWHTQLFSCCSLDFPFISILIPLKSSRFTHEFLAMMLPQWKTWHCINRKSHSYWLKEHLISSKRNFLGKPTFDFFVKLFTDI